MVFLSVLRGLEVQKGVLYYVMIVGSGDGR